MSQDTPRGSFLRGLLAGIALAVFVVLLFGNRDQVFGGDQPNPADEVLELLEDGYFTEPDIEALEQASAEGIVRELRKRYDDRFSHYFDPESYKSFQSSTSGEFSGVGLSVSEVKKGLRVSSVFSETPAERAGIEEGDLIIGVDGESIKGISSSEATAKIKGEPGTQVELELRRRTGGVETLTVERAQVRIPAVRGELQRLDSGKKIAYAALGGFSSGAHGELRAEIESQYRRGAEGLILDLRGNGGGLLTEGVLVSSLFVEDGTVVSTAGRKQPDRDFEARGDALDPRPTVVLVNRDTASASEIVTAALQQNDLATIVGTTTFGKGTFQEVIPLDAGGALDITVGEYRTSDGTSINGVGVKPDIRAKDDPDTEHDEALQRALEVLAPKLPAA